MFFTNPIMLSPENFVLEGLYADIESSSLKNIEIYTNGCMQARIYVGYGYLDSNFDADPENLDDFIRSNIKFYSIARDGSIHPLGWTVSPLNNGYEHDTKSTDRAVPETFSPWMTVFARRVPLYIVPPATFPDAVTSICARLEGAGDFGTCNNDFPVRVRTRKFRVNASDFELHYIRASGNANLHVLSYDHHGDHCLPDWHRLTQWLNPGGKSAADPTTWVAMQWSTPLGNEPPAPTIGPAMPAAAEPDLRRDFASLAPPYSLDADAIFFDKGGFISNVGILPEAATPGHLPIVCVHDSRMPAEGGGNIKKLDFVYKRLVGDNYGNQTMISINWGYSSSWCDRWAVSDARPFFD